MVRAGLRRVLEAEGDLHVVADEGDVEAALEATRRHQPQLIVLDLHMHGTSTLSAIPQFLEAAPSSAVIVLTMESEPRFARAALSEGAHGYVLKEAAEGELVEAVRFVLAGGTYLAPALGARLAMEKTVDQRRLIQGDPGQAVGSIFAGHRIDAFLGRGGMGLVFRAIDVALDRPVALKVIAPEVASDPGFRTRFERECRLAAAIDHPHAVEVFHAGEEDGLLYLTMRYIDGQNLAGLLSEVGRLEQRRAASILAQVAGALDEAHRIGLIHRDVKPANILIATRAGGEHAFLTDFGVTRQVTEGQETQTAVALGTVDYAAPEQIQGRGVDSRADVYSLGCVLFECLTGEVPFSRDGELAKLWAHVHETPPDPVALNPDLPETFRAVLSRALAKTPDQRQQSAGQLAQEAWQALDGSPGAV